jgi:hypothetical protein
MQVEILTSPAMQVLTCVPRAGLLPPDYIRGQQRWNHCSGDAFALVALLAERVSAKVRARDGPLNWYSVTP